MTEIILQPLSDTSTTTSLPFSSNSSLAELVVVDSFVSLLFESKISQACNPHPTSIIALDSSLDENSDVSKKSSAGEELDHNESVSGTKKDKNRGTFSYFESPAGQSVSISSPSSYINLAST